MMSLSAANSSKQLTSTPAKMRNVAAISKSKSNESLDRLGQGMRHSNVHPPPSRPATIRPAVVTPTKNARDTSRVEVLLAQKTSKQVFKAAEESAQSRATNKAIKQSGLWTDVQKVILQVQKLTPGNAAFAIYRLGCLNCFASRKRKADLAASGLVPSLLHTATAAPDKLDPGSLVLILDGCARLQHSVPAHVLSSLASTAQRMITSFDSLQLPLVLWAFSVLDYAPPVSLLISFDDVIPELADAMSPQGLCLTLQGFQAPGYKPSQSTLNCLSEQLYRMLPVSKPSEVACCLEAFSHFDYQPPAYIIAPILTQAGQSAPSNEAFETFQSPAISLANGHIPARAAGKQPQGCLRDHGPSSKMVEAVRSSVRNADARWISPTSTAPSKSGKAEQVTLP